MKNPNSVLKSCGLAFCALGALALYGIAPTRIYDQRPWEHENGISFVASTRLNKDPTLDQEAIGGIRKSPWQSTEDGHQPIHEELHV